MIQHSFRASKGFTIIELIIVITVIAILATIGIVAYGSVTQNARDKSILTDLDGVAAEITRYSVKNNGAYGSAVAWYSEGSPNANIKFTPSAGNVIDVVANNDGYCIRGYNPASASATLELSKTKDAPSGVCNALDPSTQALADAGITNLCPTGYIRVPGNVMFNTYSFCAMKYEAKNVGGVATSQASGSPWTAVTQASAVSLSDAACDGCHLMTLDERLTIAHNVLNVSSNWSGGSVGSGYIYYGHTDNTPSNSLTASSNDSDGYNGTSNTAPSAQKRTLVLSNGQTIWDFAGNVQERINQTIAGGQQPGLLGEVAYAYKQWNNGSLVLNGLTASAIPSYGTAAASAWTSAQGLGQLYSNYGESLTRAYMLGGDWSSGSTGGIFSTSINVSTTSTPASLGFRVAK